MSGRNFFRAFGSERNARRETKRGQEFSGRLEKLEDRVLLTISNPIFDGTAGDDTFIVSRNEAETGQVEVYLNGGMVGAYGISELGSLTINGLGNNDTLIVDSTNGLITIAGGIRYYGDSGIDTLEMRQTGGSQTSETIVVGNTAGSGFDTIVGDSGTQTVQFEDLEPIITNVIAANLNINGGTIGSLLNAANSINYVTSSLFGPTWGEVTIDAFEPIHFTNKGALNIDAEAGSDEISLNNPNLPTMLTSINIDGSDPTNDVVS